LIVKKGKFPFCLTVLITDLVVLHDPDSAAGNLAGGDKAVKRILYKIHVLHPFLILLLFYFYYDSEQAETQQEKGKEVAFLPALRYILFEIV